MTASIASPADRLAEAARVLREEWDDPADRRVFPLTWKRAEATAAWLRQASIDVWAHGGPHCAEGCAECDDDLLAPHLRRALTLADAVLDGTSAP